MSSSKDHRFSAAEVAAYEKKRYRGLDQRVVHWREERIIRRLLSLLDMPHGEEKLCLDAPCGYGRFSRLLLQQGFQLVSSDLSLAMVERARQKAFFSIYPIGIVSNIKIGLPFAEETFSVVFCLRFFHHLHQPEERKAVRREFHRVCRSAVIVSFYCSPFIHRVQRKLRQWWRPSPTKIAMISASTFCQEAEEAGFQVKKLVPLWRGIHAQNLALLIKKDLPSSCLKSGS